MTQVQITIAKPANKPAKTAAKPASTVKTAAKAVAVDTVKYRVAPSFRPGSGALLFAYTMAWLQASGLIDGGKIPLTKARAIAGGTAIDFHMGSRNRRGVPNFDTDGDNVYLTAGAANFFADRKHEAKTREAYITMMQTGVIDGALIKQQSGLTPA